MRGDRNRERAVTKDVKPLGVICALPEEIEHLGAALAIDATTERAGFQFRQGRLDGCPVVLVEGGIGKVGGALVATLLLECFGCRGLLLSGVAGGLDPDLGIGDVVIAERLIQHDYGAMMEGRLKPYRPGVPPLGESRDRLAFEIEAGMRAAVAGALDGFTLPALSAAATGGAPRVPRLRFGTVLTGDQFINCEATRRRLFESFAAQAVEMEGAAVAQIAERYGVPCVIFRSLSDLAGAGSHLDFAAFLAATAEGAARVLRRVIPAL
jgi:adenosylhomocysteine nucleosidase